MMLELMCRYCHIVTAPGAHADIFTHPPPQPSGGNYGSANVSQMVFARRLPMSCIREFVTEKTVVVVVVVVHNRSMARFSSFSVLHSPPFYHPLHCAGRVNDSTNLSSVIFSLSSHAHSSLLNHPCGPDRRLLCALCIQIGIALCTHTLSHPI